MTNKLVQEIGIHLPYKEYSMKYFILITFFLESILSGCIYRASTLKLKGKVVDNNTNVTIPNRTIIVFTAKNEVTDLDSVLVIGKFFTDSLGRFSYMLPKVKNVKLYSFYILGDSSYASSVNVLGLSELNRNDKDLSFKLRKLTDLKIKIIRTTQEPFYDNLYITWESDKDNGKKLFPYKVENNGFMSNNRLQWSGGKINSVIKTKVYANEITIIRFKLFRDWKYMEFVDTIFCKADVNNTVQFKY